MDRKSQDRDVLIRNKMYSSQAVKVPKTAFDFRSPPFIVQSSYNRAKYLAQHSMNKQQIIVII